MSSLRASALAVCLAGGLLGCQPPLPELQAQGQRVSVGVQGDVELCAGTLRAWDDHVASVEAQLGVMRSPSDRIEVYVVDDPEPWCDDVMACYIGGWVDATFVPSYAPHAIWHELVHHVVSGSDLGMTDRFLSEGLAGSLGDDWCPTLGTTWPEPPLLTLLARNDVPYEHYPRAAQFADWVRQEHGTAALVRLVDCIDRGDPLSAVEACMQQVLGEGIIAVGDHFADSTPALHGNPAVCGGEPVPRRDGRWDIDLPLSCADPGVSNGFRSRHDREVTVLVDIPRVGNYELAMLADGHATIEIDPCFCPGREDGLLHIPGEDSFWVGEPGRYRLVFRTDDPGTTRLQAQLWALDDGDLIAFAG